MTAADDVVEEVAATGIGGQVSEFVKDQQRGLGVGAQSTFERR